MATINMQIEIYTSPYLLTNAKSHSQVLYVMVDSAMTTQFVAYIEPPWAIYKLDTVVSTM